MDFFCIYATTNISPLRGLMEMFSNKKILQNIIVLQDFFIVPISYQKPFAFLIYNSKAPVMDGAFGKGA
jgi:hypothetical protein